MKIKINPGLEHITDRADLLQDFVVFVCKDLQCMPCDIDIVNGRDSSGLKTTAQYDPNNHRVMINGKNRHFGDVLRSIAHELVHHKQNVNGELSGPVQDVGGDIEDEANARAGALLKSFAYRKGPERIYEQKQIRLLEDVVAEDLRSTLDNFADKFPQLDLLATASGTGSWSDIARKAKEKVKGWRKKGEDAWTTRLQTFPNRSISDKDLLCRLHSEELEVDDWTTEIFPAGGPGISAQKYTPWASEKAITYPGAGIAVHAAMEGVVQEIGYDDARGNYIVIGHLVNIYDGDEEIGFEVYRTSYNFMSAVRSRANAPGKPVEEGSIIGYTNMHQDPVPQSPHEKPFVFTYEQIGKRDFSKDGFPKDCADASRSLFGTPVFLNPLAEGRLLEQAGDSLDSMKRSFVDRMFRVVPPLANMKVTSAAGKRNLTGKVESHGGIDYSAPIGTPVRSPIAGKVVAIQTGMPQFDARKYSREDLKPGEASGNYVVIQSLYKWPDGKKRRISLVHLDDGTIEVKKNQIVAAGQLVARSGNSGRTTGPHLHLTLKRSSARGDIYTDFGSFVDDVRSLKGDFNREMSDDEAFLALLRRSFPKQYISESTAESRDKELFKTYINEVLTTYGLGRIDPMGGGVGRMFKLGVDYENASTNIPAVGQGYVDRSHSLPYEITLRTSLDPREMFKTMFKDDFSTDYILIVPDQVNFTDDGFRLQAHVFTGTNQGDEMDVKRISGELYKYAQGLPSTPKDANFIIDVKPVADKIKYFV